MRRLVTGLNTDGVSAIVSDGIPPRTRDYTSLTDFSIALVWATEPQDGPNVSGSDSTVEVTSIVPGPGATRLMRLQIPPDRALFSPDVDLAAVAAEHMATAPGLAEKLEADGMHSTATVDYVIVTEGELSMQTDDGSITTLRAGDVLIQNATRHAWRNFSDRPAAMIVVLVGVDGAAS